VAIHELLKIDIQKYQRKATNQEARVSK